MKQEILNWLQSPRVYLEGVRLYDQYGYNNILKRNFNRGQAETMMDMLVYELGRLVGLNEHEVAKLPRKASDPKPVKKVAVTPVDDLLIQLAESLGTTVDEIFSNEAALTELTEAQQQAVEKLAPAYAQVPETIKKVIRIREKYPFLRSQDCPEEFKIMVADMFTAYDNYREAYTLLSDKNTKDENLQLAEAVVENYLANRAMWEELDYYLANGEILGNLPIFELLKLRKEISDLSDMDLIKKLNTTKPNITKSKKSIETAKDAEEKAEAEKRMAKWQQVKSEVEAEIERRKK